ncbi:MAG: MIP family channel protein [Dehalococcoidia bacterium]
MAIQLGFQPQDFSLKTWRAVAAEFIGTGMFVTIGVGSVVAANAFITDQGAPLPAVPGVGLIIAVAIAHGLGILLAVSATAGISGGHINPAVTFAMVLTGRTKISTGVLYVAAQLVAATFAVLLIKAVISGPYQSGLGVHGLSSVLEDNVGNGSGAGLLVEGVLTFFLVYVVYATAVDPKGPRNLAPAAIGLVIMADHFVGIPLTGASMNPARSFGPAMVAQNWADHWVYWIGPLVGAAVAAAVYELVFMTRGDE